VTKLQEALKQRGACQEAIDWVGERDFETAWRECSRLDWMFWLLNKMQGKPSWPRLETIMKTTITCVLEYQETRWIGYLRENLSVPRELVL